MRSIYTFVPNRHVSRNHHYSPDVLVEAWGLLLQSRLELPNPAQPNGPWEYDLVDVTRQVLDNLFHDAYGLLDGAYDAYVATRRDPFNQVKTIGAALIQILSDIDTILATNQNYLLGVWTERARSWATNEDEKRLYEFNARNQITLWGPNGEINDYASKEWAGLVGTYYRPRWQIFVAYLFDSITKGTVIDPSKYAADLLLWEQRWNNQTNAFPSQASGKVAEVSQALYERYVSAAELKQHFRRLPNTDAPANDIHRQPQTTVVGQLMYLCFLDPACQGFNSNGHLKSSVASTTTSADVDLYIRSR